MHAAAVLVLGAALAAALALFLPSLSEMSSDPFKDADADQIAMMAEEVILVDDNDKAIGSASKKDSHLQPGKLHRAFSVFLINSEGKLLLQRRAAAKITFPMLWTNTCCSHPLSRPEEMIEENQMGVKNAAVRKLEQELGIKPEQVPVDKFNWVTRIHYKASSDDTWVEHEIDYVLFIQADVDVNVNPNEVESVKYVSKEEMQAIMRDQEILKEYTPWFKLIADSDDGFLFQLWDEWLANKDGKALTTLNDPTIHNFIEKKE